MICEQVRLSWVCLHQVNDAHAQRKVGNGVFVIPPHDFELPRHWYYRL